MTQADPCAHCEEMMQPYLDHILSEEERLRVYVRQVVSEPMPAELKAKLSALRIEL
jgi:hypothetical protein